MKLTKKEQILVRQAKREVIVNIVSGALLIGTYLVGITYMFMK